MVKTQTNYNIQPATQANLQAILKLLAKNNLPPDGLAGHLATTLVARNGQEIIGCAALEFYGASALLRSVAVAESYRGQGLGQQLTQAALKLARQQGVGHIYLLTETAAGFFPKFGFQPINRTQIPAAVKNSVEFTSACPESALAMALPLR